MWCACYVIAQMTRQLRLSLKIKYSALRLDIVAKLEMENVTCRLIVSVKSFWKWSHAAKNKRSKGEKLANYLNRVNNRHICDICDVKWLQHWSVKKKFGYLGLASFSSMSSAFWSWQLCLHYNVSWLCKHGIHHVQHGICSW